MRDWSKPQQQSAMALVILAIKIAKQMFGIVWPFLLATVFRKKDNPILFWTITIAAFLLFIIVKALIDHFTFRFYVLNHELIIRSGIFRKSIITIPLEKIQTVHLEQQFWHSITGTTKVLIDTPGSEKTEVAIQALSTADAAAFKQMILAETRSTATVAIPLPDQIILHLKLKDLLQLSLSANHLETLGLILFFVLARLDDVKKLFDLDAFNWLETQSETVAFTWQIVTAIIVFMLLFAFVISVVRTVLRYFDMKVTASAKGLTIKWGLLQIKQHIIPFNKIQLLEWRANFIRRKLGLYLVQLKATGEMEAGKKKQKILVPTTNIEQTKAIVATYQAQTNSTTTAATIQKAYVKRRILMICLPVTALLVGITAIWWQWYASFFLLWLMYYAWSMHRFKHNFKYWISNDGLQLYKGVWGRQHILLNWEKIQLATTTQSLYQRKKGYANLVLHTAGGSVTLPYLLQSEAITLQNIALYKTATATKNWM
jgi:putative membrane protein